MGKYKSSSYKATSPYPTTVYPTPVLPLDMELVLGICKQQGDSGNEHLEMIPHLTALVEEMGLVPLFDKKGNMYITKGTADIYPCMVAHLDTVHDYEEGYDVAISADGKVLYAFAAGEADENLTALSPPIKQAGVGGDDRVGIAIAMQLLRTLDNFKIVFFLEEEIGCRGSREAYMPFFDDVSLVLQCDRQGANEWVQTVAGTQVSSNEFIQKIQPLLTHHSYRTIQNGGITDVGALKSNGLPVCAANMGCGYYSPHTEKETIYLPAMQNTLDLCYAVYLLVGHEKQLHTYTPYRYAASSTSSSTTNKAYKPAFYPRDHGWQQVEVDEVVQPVHAHSKPWTRKKWMWQKELADGLMLGPCEYMEVEKVHIAHQAEIAAAEGKKKQEELKLKKKKIKEWIELDGTWRFNKRAKMWQKFLKDTEEGEEVEYCVAVAGTILDVPFQEGEFKAEFENDLLGGILTLKEVYEYIELSKAEEQAAQMNIPFSMGSEREVFAGGYDDEGRYLPATLRKPIEDYSLSICTCPHCNSVEERFVSEETGAFYCLDCGMHSNEPVDAYKEHDKDMDDDYRQYRTTSTTRPDTGISIGG